MGACDRLLRLHHLHRIGDTRAEAVARESVGASGRCERSSAEICLVARRFGVFDLGEFRDPDRVTTAVEVGC